MRSLGSKYAFATGAPPGTQPGVLTTLPDPIVGFREGALCGGEGKGRRGKGKGWEGRRWGESGRGREGPPETAYSR